MTGQALAQAPHQHRSQMTLRMECSVRICKLERRGKRKGEVLTVPRYSVWSAANTRASQVSRER